MLRKNKLRCIKCGDETIMNERELSVALKKDLEDKKSKGDQTDPEIKCPKCNGKMGIVGGYGIQKD